MKTYYEYKSIIKKTKQSPEQKKDYFIAKEQLRKNLFSFTMNDINDLYTTFPEERNFFFKKEIQTQLVEKAIAEQTIFLGLIQKNAKGANFQDYFKLLDLKKHKSLIEDYLDSGNLLINDSLVNKYIECNLVSENILTLSKQKLIDYLLYLDKKGEYKEIHRYLDNICDAADCLMRNEQDINKYSEELKNILINYNNDYLFYFDFKKEEILEKLNKIEVNINLLNTVEAQLYKKEICERYFSKFDLNKKEDLAKILNETLNKFNNIEVFEELINNQSVDKIKEILNQKTNLVISVEIGEYFSTEVFECNIMQMIFYSYNSPELKKYLIKNYEEFLYYPITKEVKNLNFNRDFLETMFEQENYGIFENLTPPNKYKDLRVASAFYHMISLKSKMGDWSYQLIKSLDNEIIESYETILKKEEGFVQEHKDFLETLKQKNNIKQLIDEPLNVENNLFKL